MRFQKQPVDAHGNEKRFGGDVFYVSYTDKALYEQQLPGQQQYEIDMRAYLERQAVNNNKITEACRDRQNRRRGIENDRVKILIP